MKILVKVEAFIRLAPSKLNFKKDFNGCICAYSVFYLHIFRRIEGSRSLRYRKKRGPERVKEVVRLNYSLMHEGAPGGPGSLYVPP